MPLPSDFTENLVEGGAIKLVNFTRDPGTIEPGQRSLLEWNIDPGPFTVHVKLEGEEVGLKDQKHVQPTFTKTYHLDVLYSPSSSTDYATLATRTVNVDTSGCVVLPIPIDEVTDDVRDEIQEALKDNGFSDAKLRSVRITGQGIAARAETGTLNVVTIIAMEIVKVPVTFTIEISLLTKLGDVGRIVFTDMSTSVNIEEHPTNLGQKLMSLAIDALKSFAEDELPKWISPALEEALKDATDDIPKTDWLYALLLESMQMYICPGMASDPKGAPPASPDKPIPTKVDAVPQPPISPRRRRPPRRTP